MNGIYKSEQQQTQSTTLEQRVLKNSICFTFIVAGAGVIFGLLCGSMSIVFDGMFSAVDAGMCSLSLLVPGLLLSHLAVVFNMVFYTWNH